MGKTYTDFSLLSKGMFKDTGSFVDARTIAALERLGFKYVSGNKIRRSLHRLLFSTETDGTTTYNCYDAFGRVAATSRTGCQPVPDGDTGATGILPVATFDYASSGDLLAKHTYTNGTDVITESYSYDMLGNHIATTDALGNTIHRTYDPLGNIIAEWGATYPVRYTYDTAGRRTSLSTTRDGTTWDTTTWAYDADTGNCRSKTYADDSTVTYTYTPDNLPLRTTYASGRWKENVYDERRQVVAVEYSDGETVSLAHDAYLDEIAFSNDVAATNLDRDEKGNCTNDTAVVGDESKTIERKFDTFRRLIESDGSIYDYNADGLLASISNDIALVEYAYTPDRLDAGYSLTLSNGVVFTRSIERDGYRRSLVTGISSVANGVGVGSLSYTYDALNRPTTRNNDSFGYNARSEVTAANVSGVSSTYGYDEIGNSTNWAANCLNQYAEFMHDADGNMTQCGDWAYTYDAANRLKTVSSNGVLLVTNFYDAKSRRVKKMTPVATTTFFYDNWNLIEERIAYTNGTSSTIHYYWGKDLSGTFQGAGGVGGLLYLTIDDMPYIPTYDNNGNIARYLDASGNTVAQYTYDAFGNLISKSGPLADFFRHRFSTKYYDIETDHYYYGYRFYSSSLMRWLNSDPMGVYGGLNLYSFCENCSVVKFDAVGLAVVNEHLAVLYDVTTGIKKNTMLAYTDVSAIVRVSCKCNKSRWSLDSVKVDITTTVHHQRGGYGTNISASFFAHKSEAEHVNDIKTGVRNLISPTVGIQELVLKLSSYNAQNECVDANRKVFASLVHKLLTKISQESVDRHDKSGDHTWRGL